MSSLSTKHIPTLLGLLVLAGGLVGGIFLANSATTGFLPRASPETTPKNLKISNITDTSFTVSWVTDSKTPGYVKFGSSASNLTTTVTDDRDQISGSVGLFRTHHVTLRTLSPSTTYYYKIGTGTQELYDDAGSPYQTRTGAPIVSSARTIYGQVSDSSGAISAGALVYISGDSLAPLSTLTQSTGSFVLSLAQARTKDNASPANLSDETFISILVVSPTDDTTSVIEGTIAQAQPVPDVVLGSNQDLTNPFSTPEPTASASAQVQSKFTSQLLSPPTESSESAKLRINSTSATEIHTSAKPTFSGSAPKNTTVSLSIKGPSTITSSTNADATGAWKYTPTANLKNGSYTLTASAVVNSVKESQTLAFTIATPAPTANASTSANTVSYPSTESGEIVSGTTEVSFGIALAGILLITSGVLFASTKQTSVAKTSSCGESETSLL